MNDKQKEHLTNICRFVGYALWFPMGNLILEIMYKEVEVSDVNLSGCIISFVIGCIMHYIGYIILESETKNDNGNNINKESINDDD